MAWLTKTYFDFAFYTRRAAAAIGDPGRDTIDLKDLNPLGDCGKIDCIIDKITNALIIISIPIVSIMVLIGGFYILTAGGNETRFKTGKSIITYSIIGFAVVLVAKSVATLIRNLLTGS